MLLLLAFSLTVAGESGLSAALRAPGTLQARIRFEHLTSADGLSHDSVFAILQDQHGFMWFGTQGGLNRYDGYRVTQFRHNPRDPSTIAEDFVQFLFEDSRGAIWAGRNGLSRFDPATEKFTRFEIPVGSSFHGRGMSVYAIGEDRDGFLWLGMSSGRVFYRLDPNNGKFTGFDIGGGLPQGLDSGITSMHRDRAGNFWLGTYNGLVRFDPTNGGCTRFPQDRPNPKVLDDRTLGIAEDQHGNLWLAAREGAWNHFNPLARAFTRRWAAPDRQRLGDDINRTVVVGSDGIVWLGTMEGLKVYDPVTGAFAVLRNNAADRHSLSSNESSFSRRGSRWQHLDRHQRRWRRPLLAFQCAIRRVAAQS